MKQKLFVLNGSPQQLQEIQAMHGEDYDIVVCHSAGEVQRNLEQCKSGVVLPLATPTNGLNGNRGMDHASVASTDIERLVSTIVSGANGDQAIPKSLAARVDLLEQKISESTLSRNRHHRKDTAAELGISRVTLYNKMKKFGMLN